jgi:hypothetical protein
MYNFLKVGDRIICYASPIDEFLAKTATVLHVSDDGDSIKVKFDHDYTPQYCYESKFRKLTKLDIALN